MIPKFSGRISGEVPAEAAARAHERDNGRRGEPLPGCDCLRCFGRCSVDKDVAMREAASRRDAVRDEPTPLDFNDEA